MATTPPLTTPASTPTCDKPISSTDATPCGRPWWHAGWHAPDRLLSDMRPHKVVGTISFAKAA